MTDSDLDKLLGKAEDDFTCDDAVELIDEYCERVHRGEPLTERFAQFVTHQINCTACREDTESLLAVLRDRENSDTR